MLVLQFVRTQRAQDFADPRKRQGVAEDPQESAPLLGKVHGVRKGQNWSVQRGRSGKRSRGNQDAMKTVSSGMHLRKTNVEKREAAEYLLLAATFCRDSRRYRWHNRPLPTFDFRVGKFSYLVSTARSLQARRSTRGTLSPVVMSLLCLSEKRALRDCDETCEPYRAFVDVAKSLRHPYLHQILNVHVVRRSAAHPVLAFVGRKSKLGSLKDVLYANKPRERHASRIRESSLQIWGAQILEGMMALHSLGFRHLHLHLGNILVWDMEETEEHPKITLSGLENSLLGLPISATRRRLIRRAASYGIASVDAILFGHCFFEMAYGLAVDTVKPDYVGLDDSRRALSHPIRQCLDLIFEGRHYVPDAEGEFGDVSDAESNEGDPRISMGSVGSQESHAGEHGHAHFGCPPGCKDPSHRHPGINLRVLRALPFFNGREVMDQVMRVRALPEIPMSLSSDRVVEETLEDDGIAVEIRGMHKYIRAVDTQQCTRWGKLMMPVRPTSRDEEAMEWAQKIRRRVRSASSRPRLARSPSKSRTAMDNMAGEVDSPKDEDQDPVVVDIADAGEGKIPSPITNVKVEEEVRVGGGGGGGDVISRNKNEVAEKVDITRQSPLAVGGRGALLASINALRVD